MDVLCETATRTEDRRLGEPRERVTSPDHHPIATFQRPLGCAHTSVPPTLEQTATLVEEYRLFQPPLSLPTKSKYLLRQLIVANPSRARRAGLKLRPLPQKAEGEEGRLTKLETLQAVLQRGTARSRLLAERFHSAPTQTFEPLCPHITKLDCAKSSHALTGHFTACSLASCTSAPSSARNTCYSEPSYALSPSIGPAPARASGSVYLLSGLGAGGRGKEKAPCRYCTLKWAMTGGGAWSTPVERHGEGPPSVQAAGRSPGAAQRGLRPSQWVNCDLRKFDYGLPGKFHVIMADLLHRRISISVCLLSSPTALQTSEQQG
ncbi:hypothetical protein CALCODRAFT_514278 [Calocera cornea HHB12733]|uniref:Uncharacterized protein n=1 Tax=Calocera cornea HHB12733 TaxID=1353952 RepID=A0A165JRT4_9BASI|nr:hypothetical protein CALCODRAFT_514278 [Calocera cornea HHB12733]